MNGTLKVSGRKGKVGKDNRYSLVHRHAIGLDNVDASIH